MGGEEEEGRGDHLKKISKTADAARSIFKQVILLMAKF
jgi:hypothetical protein